jgi:hypothetical protein
MLAFPVATDWINRGALAKSAPEGDQQPRADPIGQELLVASPPALVDKESPIN